MPLLSEIWPETHFVNEEQEMLTNQGRYFVGSITNYPDKLINEDSASRSFVAFPPSWPPGRRIFLFLTGYILYDVKILCKCNASWLHGSHRIRVALFKLGIFLFSVALLMCQVHKKSKVQELLSIGKDRMHKKNAQGRSKLTILKAEWRTVKLYSVIL